MKEYNSLLDLINATCMKSEYIDVFGIFSKINFKCNNFKRMLSLRHNSYSDFLEFISSITNIKIESFDPEIPLIVNKQNDKFIDSLKKFDEYLLNFKLYDDNRSDTDNIFRLNIICSEEFYANLILWDTL